MTVLLLGLTFIAATWLYMHHWYVKIHGHRLKWWAIPFAHGAVMFARRLPHWER